MERKRIEKVRPSDLGKERKVHNGKEWVARNRPETDTSPIGLFFGERAKTRKSYNANQNKKKKKGK